MTAPVPPGAHDTQPLLRHATMVLLSGHVQMSTALGVSGRGSLRIGAETSALDVVCEDFDTARRLYQAAGELLDRLERDQAARRHSSYPDTPRLQAVPRG